MRDLNGLFWGHPRLANPVRHLLRELKRPTKKQTTCAVQSTVKVNRYESLMGLLLGETPIFWGLDEQVLMVILFI